MANKMIKNSILLVATIIFVPCVNTGADETIDFKRDVKPLFSQRCVKCHGPEKQKGGLRFDLKSSAMAKADSGEPAIVPGNARESRLYQLISSKDDDQRMPPTGEPLSDQQLELLRRWIDSGANWPDADSEKANRAEMIVTDDDREHWSFRPLQQVSLPQVIDAAWIKTPIDLFIRHAHQAKGLSPSPPAEARTLIRRLYFDLVGLPPILQEQDGKLTEKMLNLEIDPQKLVDDPSSLIDALLASQHYGERWARHWLDVARYADSNGMENDNDRPNAYRYRDFVIRSLNDDLPYNTFVKWQLAGDEIAPENPQAIAATGFIVAGSSTLLVVPMEEEKLRNRANELDDMVSTTSQAFLALTLACARCHDHKYDPLPTREYYRMMCAFNGGDRKDVLLADPATAKQYRTDLEKWQKEIEEATKQRENWLKQARQPIEKRLLIEKVAQLDLTAEQKKLLVDAPDDADSKKLASRFKKELKIEDREYVAALNNDQQQEWKQLSEAVARIESHKPVTIPAAFAFEDFSPEPPETWFFERGNFLARNERVKLGFLTVTMRGKTAEEYWNAAQESKLRDDSSQQRRAMADWITDIDHGAGVLLARVIVNRVWQHHFGYGLVRTVSDFGTRGETPSHPELLEWLTGELIRSGWSIKHLHRLITNSSTYRQGNLLDASKEAIDPENRLLWRRRPQRLESELLRDAMLTVSGSLNLAMYGKSFKPPIANEAMQARNVKDPYPKDVKESDETRRRSIYMFHKRVIQYPLMQAFDAPDAQVSCGQRLNTTVAPQALALLNDPFVRLRAIDMAKKLASEALDLNNSVRRAFQLALARQPAEDELTQALDFLVTQTASRQSRDKNLTNTVAQQLALADFCQMLFALNEFVYVD